MGRGEGLPGGDVLVVGGEVLGIDVGQGDDVNVVFEVSAVPAGDAAATDDGDARTGVGGGGGGFGGGGGLRRGRLCFVVSGGCHGAGSQEGGTGECGGTDEIASGE